MNRRVLYLAGLLALGPLGAQAQVIGGGGISTLSDGSNTFPALPTLQFSGGTLSKSAPNTLLLTINGGGTGCVPTGGSSTNVVLYGTAGACAPATQVNVSLGAMTLGSSGTLGSLILGGSTSGTATLTGGTTGVLTGLDLAITGTPSGTTSLAVTQSQTMSGTAVPAVNMHGTFLGTVSSGSPNWYSFSCDFDRVAVTGGATCFDVAASYGGGASSVLTGPRNGFGVAHTLSGDTSTGTHNYLVALAGYELANYWFGGYPGAESASIFGLNVSGRAQSSGSIGSYGDAGAISEEADVGIAHPMKAKQGINVIEWTDSNSDGWLESHAYGAALQGGGTAPGFHFIYSLGSPDGWSPMRATDAIIYGNYCTVLFPGGPACAAAVGNDNRNITFSEFQDVGPGYAVDGSGNIGGLTTSGATLQTLSAVQAKTAVVNTIAPLSATDGGEFQTIPTLVVSASPGGGTLATATVATMGLRRAYSIVGNRGTGYVVGDVLTLSGGTGTAATATVAAVDTTGEIIDFTYTPGSYTALPSNPVTLTGGTGTGANITTAVWSILTVTVTNAGTLYPQFPLPKVTTTGGTSKTVEPELVVTMTASNATLALQPSGGGLTYSGNALDAAGGLCTVGTSGSTCGLLNGTNVYSGQQSGSITTLSISTATFTPDGSNNDYAITLIHASCPCTLANPSVTPVAGTKGVIYIAQSATGSDLISTWGSDYVAPGGTANIILSTGASAADAIGYTVKDSTHIYLYPNTNFVH